MSGHSGHLALWRGDVRIQLIERNRLAIRLHEAAMHTPQTAWLRCATGMRDDPDFLFYLLLITADAVTFVFWNQASLQAFVVRRNTRWTSVPVALQGLDTTQRKHKTAGRNDEIGTQA